MKRNPTLWLILFGIPALLAIPIVVVGSSIYTPGVFDIEVMEKGGSSCNVHISAPAMLAPVALRILPDHLIGELHAEMGDEARSGLRIAHALIKELEHCPDGVFVDVRDGHDIVKIEKRGDKIIIFVDTPDERVRCSMPLQAVRQTVGSLAAL